MTLILDDIENEYNVDESRVMEYAKNRVDANKEDGFDYPTNLEEARSIIRSYGEDVLIFNIGDKIKLKEESKIKNNLNKREYLIYDISEEGYILSINDDIIKDKFFSDEDIEE